MAENQHLAASWFLQTHHLPQQRRFAAAGSADQGQHFTAAHREIQIPVHDLRAELGPQVSDFDDGF
jgi:hypothetical protein